MAPMMNSVMMIGTTQLIIILVIVVVLFGGAKLSGLGKSMGSAIREFKHETKGLAGGDDQQDEVVDAEVVEPEDQQPASPQMHRSATNSAAGSQQPDAQGAEQTVNQSGQASGSSGGS